MKQTKKVSKVTRINVIRLTDKHVAKIAEHLMDHMNELQYSQGYDPEFAKKSFAEHAQILADLLAQSSKGRQS